MSATLSLAEIQKHNNPEDCWIIIRDVVYNVTEFLNEVSLLSVNGDYVSCLVLVCSTQEARR